MLVAVLQGFSFGFGLLIAIVPAVWLIKQLPASPEVQKGIEQNAELLRLRERQKDLIERIAESSETVSLYLSKRV